MEQKLQTKILDYLKSIGAYAFKNVVAGTSGKPDIIACYKGRAIFIETKDYGKKPTKLQEYNLEQICKAGGIAFVAWDLDVVAAIINMVSDIPCNHSFDWKNKMLNEKSELSSKIDGLESEIYDLKLIIDELKEQIIY